MDYQLQLIAIPVTDVDRAKAFYADQVGFAPDHDHTVSEELRFVQLTPPGSACGRAILPIKGRDGNGLGRSGPSALMEVAGFRDDALGARMAARMPSWMGALASW